MLILLLLAETAALKVAPSTRAVATVRIHRPGRVNAEEWHRLPPAERREIRRLDKDGKPILIRVIDYP